MKDDPRSQKFPALRLRGVGKSFGDKVVLDDVGLIVDAGEVHALVGSNGSGKSTLVKIITGVYSPSAIGEMSVGGVEASLPLSLIHISEPTSRTPISYAVFCLKK